MGEIKNLEKLADQIYQEGVEKAEKESEEIISKAKGEYNRILEEARNEAKKIVTRAELEATKTIRSMQSQLELKGKQMVSDLQREIHDLISNKLLKDGISSAFADVSFLQSAILEAISCWKPDNDLELVLPQELEKKLNKAFHEGIRKHLENITITFNNKLSEGFKIVNKGDSYTVSFSKDEFIVLFSSYLTDKTNQLLFSNRS